jgi:hypothetical protein
MCRLVGGLQVSIRHGSEGGCVRGARHPFTAADITREGNVRTGREFRNEGPASSRLWPVHRFCSAHGESAERLAAPPARLVRFLHAFAGEVERDGTLRVAAAVFAGNSIAGLRADAGWVAYEGGFPTVGNGEQQFEVHRLLEGLQEAGDATVRSLASVLEDWAREVVDDSPVGGPSQCLRRQRSLAMSDLPCRR